METVGLQVTINFDPCASTKLNKMPLKSTGTNKETFKKGIYCELCFVIFCLLGYFGVIIRLFNVEARKNVRYDEKQRKF